MASTSSDQTITYIDPATEDEIDKLIYTEFKMRGKYQYLEYGTQKYFLTDRFLQFKDRIDNFEVYDDDIWIASFPRSGTTWSQQMIHGILTLDFEQNKDFRRLFPYFEQSALFNFERIQKDAKEPVAEQVPDYMLDSIGFVEKLQRPRLIKTHLPWELLPKQIRNFERRPKIIHVSRDPRDVCCSYYFFYKFVSNLVTGNFDKFAQLFLNNRVIYGPFLEHLNSYQLQKDNENLILITYEEMYQNLSDVIQKVSKFLNKNLSSNDLENLNKYLLFDEMKKNENYKNVPLNRDTAQNKFLRSGKTNTYQNLMSQDLIKLFNDKYSIKP